jgi:hypothetical protein
MVTVRGISKVGPAAIGRDGTLTLIKAFSAVARYTGCDEGETRGASAEAERLLEEGRSCGHWALLPVDIVWESLWRWMGWVMSRDEVIRFGLEAAKDEYARG